MSRRLPIDDKHCGFEQFSRGLVRKLPRFHCSLWPRKASFCSNRSLLRSKWFEISWDQSSKGAYEISATSLALSADIYLQPTLDPSRSNCNLPFDRAPSCRAVIIRCDHSMWTYNVIIRCDHHESLDRNKEKHRSWVCKPHQFNFWSVPNKRTPYRLNDKTQTITERHHCNCRSWARILFFR